MAFPDILMYRNRLYRLVVVSEDKRCAQSFARMLRRQQPPDITNRTTIRHSGKYYRVYLNTSLNSSQGGL